MSHKFLSIVRVIEMEIPPANVLLFLETRNHIVWHFPTFIFYVYFIYKKWNWSLHIYCNQYNEEDLKFLWAAGGLKKSEIEQRKKKKSMSNQIYEWVTNRQQNEMEKLVVEDEVGEVH